MISKHHPLNRSVVMQRGGHDSASRGSESQYNSLVIAKGSIIIKRNGIERTRLIAGKKVITDHADRDTHESVLISENDTNPLGFIRWADAPKDKTPTKAK